MIADPVFRSLWTMNQGLKPTAKATTTATDVAMVAPTAAVYGFMIASLAIAKQRPTATPATPVPMSTELDSPPPFYRLSHLTTEYES